MNIFLNPQRNSQGYFFSYSYAGETITAVLKKNTYFYKTSADGEYEILDHIEVDEIATDTFDFSNVGQGVMRRAVTDLPYNPIYAAERKEDGQLYVTLLNFLDEHATEEDCFPEWRKVGEKNGND